MIRTSLAGIDSPVETLIVGSGPAGLTLAMELERQGRPSLVLESGFDTAPPPTDLSRAEIVDPARHDDMSIAVARRLGGTSHLWGGRCVPLDPIDFEPRPYAQNTAWPIGYADLASYYEPASRYVACGAPVFTAPLPGHDAQDDFTLSTLERASNVPRFARAYRDHLRRSALIDVRLGATVVDLTIGEDGRATHVVVADPAGHRTSIAARTIVLAGGGLESTRLLLALQRKHEGLFGGADGPLGRFYMGHLIGEIADVVFETDALDAAFDFFRDGNGSFARRRIAPSLELMRKLDLPNICFWPVVPPIADPAHRSGALSALAMTLSTPLGRRLVPEAILKRHLGSAIDWRRHAANVVSDVPRTIGFLSTFLHQRFLSRERVHGYFIRNRARRYGLSYSSEQSPRPDSRVVLNEETDRLGMPRLSIDLRFNHDDAKAVARAHEALAGWLAARGVGQLIYRPGLGAPADAILRLASHGTHQIGLARMGTDRTRAVVDRDLRCFDIENLFVLSSATFPTSSQANPTFSLVAFAIRLAEHLAASAGRETVSRSLRQMGRADRLREEGLHRGIDVAAGVDLEEKAG